MAQLIELLLQVLLRAKALLKCLDDGLKCFEVHLPLNLCNRLFAGLRALYLIKLLRVMALHGAGDLQCAA